MTYTIYNQNKILVKEAEVADSFFSRFMGLMFKRSLPPDRGLLLKNCSSIHCCFMKFTIDAVYLDESYRVVGVETVKPWRLGHFHRGTRHILELKAHKAIELTPGTVLTLKEI